MKPIGICTMQIGKNGLTKNIIMAIGDAFAAHGNIKISVFKSATQDKRAIEKMALEICTALGRKFTYRVVGHTIFLKKWKKQMRR